DSAAAVPRAHSGGDFLYGRALDYPDRFGIRSRTRRVVVPAADRSVNRALDRIHGDREHRRDRFGAAMGGGLRIWAGTRLRLLVRVARDAAIRGVASAGVAGVIQRGGRVGAIAGAAGAGSGARSALS